MDKLNSRIGTLICCSTCLQLIPLGLMGAEDERPNVIFILVDDQGYGDLSCHGDPILKTPNIDALYGESTRFTDYHAGTTSSPTRASLMSGMYSTRVGVWHTIMGRYFLDKETTTLADVFSENGYSTALFGKWHLGDNYPFRPMDRGFSEVLCNKSGGVGQVADYWGNTYFDDTYYRNGVPEKQKGYCTDVWFKESIKYIKESVERKTPFFCYLSLNAPHDPYHVEEKYASKYRNIEGVASAEFYGMISNIDENVGILEKSLEELGIKDNTILIYTTDNGTSGGSYSAGLRGRKASPYDGGHRVPFFLRWKDGGLSVGKDFSMLSSCIDVMPTLMGLCDLSTSELDHDGIDLIPYIKEEKASDDDRILFVDTQYAEKVTMWKQSSVMTKKWRLINGKQLFNMDNDRGQLNNVSKKYPEVVSLLRGAYINWWNHNQNAYNKESYIIIGNDAENPVTLTNMDCHTISIKNIAWDQPLVRKGIEAKGYWAIEVESDGNYEIEL